MAYPMKKQRCFFYGNFRAKSPNVNNALQKAKKCIKIEVDEVYPDRE
ncbi:Hypothetical protein I595_3165 [Croceitalea dokdonensis DOKDO 023]|uniref:Uncharacterized protein n=1 Tax=Croceitalea dokdonensis DOKDO 023 TaxID=1300341 RepID=A0A0P7AYU4_9FLAO|nr:Hypothetical protein I595_3165 [Croceitalea dokdonensis DOKDO 023]